MTRFAITRSAGWLRLRAQGVALDVRVPVDRDIVYKVGRRISQRFPHTPLSVDFGDGNGHTSSMVDGSFHSED